MSLVGSLEDLGLGDILQIVSLSGKSGLLQLRSEAGEGWILIQGGEVKGAVLRHGPQNLRELLAAREAVEKERLEAACRRARRRQEPLETVLVEKGLLAADALEELRREHVERTVFEMFSWPNGEFSFEMNQRPPAREGEGLMLARGLSGQFLALEGARLRDEARSESGTPQASREPTSPPLAVEAGFEPLPEVPPEAEAEGAEPVGPGRRAPGLEATLEAEADLEVEPEAPEGFEAACGAGGESTPRVGSESPVEPKEPLPKAVARRASPEPLDRRRPAGSPIVVALDRTLARLEWLKRVLAGMARRVHIFQRSEDAVVRIRQYLARGERPVVLLSEDAPPDPVSGAHGAEDIARRLRSQDPGLAIVAWVDRPAEGGRATTPPWADSLLERPRLEVIGSPRRSDQAQELARRSAEILAQAAPRPGAPAAPEGVPPRELERLRAASARLRDPRSRGEILRIVLDYAAGSFGRVALFMVREGKALGMAQVGLARAGGPDAAEFRKLVVSIERCGWFRRVVREHAPLRAVPSEAGERELVARLGNEVPDQVYVAPLMSGDRVAALLYADQLPERAALPETAALEVVLHEAGLALDRALLERALEAGDNTPVSSPQGSWEG